MKLKNAHIAVVSFWLLSSSMLWAGGLEKGLSDLRNKDYYGAKKQFEKILFKDPVGGNYGLSLVHFEKQNPFYDIDRSLRFCNGADSAYQFALQRDKDELREFGIDGATIKELRKSIGIRAYEDLMENPTDERIDHFLVKYRFSVRYGEVVKERDHRAFESAKERDTYESYRQFIIDFPGSEQRQIADSLYAFRFFEAKTSSGSIEGYRQFVEEFPANPYSSQAYDTLFSWTQKAGTCSAYQDYIIDFPLNRNTQEAWRAVNSILLRNYSEKQIQHMIANLQGNPFKELLEKELVLIRERRFIMDTPKGQTLVGIDGKTYGKTYEEIEDFNEGLAKVTKNGKSGFINKLGVEVIPLKFNDAFSMNSGMAVVEKEGKFGAIDRFGRVTIPFVFDELGNARHGLLAFERRGRSGFVDWRGQMKFKQTFEFASDFKDGYAIVRVNGLYGAIDTLGIYSIPALYDWVEENSGKRSRVRSGGLFGVYAHGVGLVIPIGLEKLGTLSSGLYAFVSNGKVGYLNERGDTAIAPRFEVFSEQMDKYKFENNHAVASVNGKKGLIDISGEFVLSPLYEELIYSGENILSFKSKNRWGHLKLDGSKLPGLYDSVGEFDQNLAIVENNGFKGLITSSGKVILATEFEEVRPIRDTELVIFQKNGLKGIKNREGETILEARFTEIEPFNLRFAKLSIDGQDQLYDLDNAKVKWTSVKK